MVTNKESEDYHMKCQKQHDRLCCLVVRVSDYRSRGPGLDSRWFKIFWEAAGLNGVHSASWEQLRSYLEEIVAAPVYKIEIGYRGNPLRWPRDTLYPQKLALTSPTSGGRSVGIVRSRTKVTEFSFVSFFLMPELNLAHNIFLPSLSINNHNSQLTLHTDSHASDSGALRREGR
jgi:hypothetical protein